MSVRMTIRQRFQLKFRRYSLRRSSVRTFSISVLLLILSIPLQAQEKSFWQRLHEGAMQLESERAQIEQEERNKNDALFTGIGQSACRDIPRDVRDPNMRALYRDYIDGFISGWNLESSALDTIPYGLAGSGIDDTLSLVLTQEFMNHYCDTFFGRGLSLFIDHRERGRGTGISMRGVGLKRCAQFAQDMTSPTNRIKYEQWSRGFIDGSNSLARNRQENEIRMNASPLQVIERECYSGNPATSVAGVMIRFTDSTKRRASSIR